MESSQVQTVINKHEKIKHTDFSIDTLLKETKTFTADNNQHQLFNFEENLEEEYGDADDEESFSKPPSLENENNRLEHTDMESSSEYFNSKEGSSYPWLSCTRFKPPKLPRSKKRIGCKRYGRGPRIPFAPHQIAVLESTFMKSQYLSSECIHRLADTLHLSETRVKIWFQNRRARYRREKEGSIPGHSDKNIQLQVGPEFQFQHLPGDSRPRGFPDMSNQIFPGNYRKYCELSLHEPEKVQTESPNEEVVTNTGESFSNFCQERRNYWIPESIMNQIQTYRQVQQQLQNYILQNKTEANPNTATILQSVLQYAHAAAVAQQQAPTQIEPLESKDISTHKVSPIKKVRNQDQEDAKPQSPQRLSPNLFANLYYNNNNNNHNTISPSNPFQLPFH